MSNVLNKWSGEFFADLAERVVATFLGALLAVVTLTSQTPIDWSDGQVVWTVLGVPTLVSLIKGLLANLANADSGASALPAPPGPEVNEGGYAVLGGLGLALVILAVLLAVLTVLKVAVISWVAIVVVLVIGLGLIFVDSRNGRRVV